jgi:hypothetical protein
MNEPLHYCIAANMNVKENEENKGSCKFICVSYEKNLCTWDNLG